MDKQNVVYPQKGMILNHNKNGIIRHTNQLKMNLNVLPKMLHFYHRNNRKALKNLNVQTKHINNSHFIFMTEALEHDYSIAILPFTNFKEIMMIHPDWRLIIR